MAKIKQTQVPLVSADGSTTQPPFPGGWVLTVLESLERFLGVECSRPISDRTESRINQGGPIKKTTYDGLEGTLASLVSQHFPCVASIHGFTEKYCQEYFRCWHAAVTVAPIFARAFGHEPGPRAILARVLVRDLSLRFAYLESCDRALAQDNTLARPQTIFQFKGPRGIYTEMLKRRKAVLNGSAEELAESLKTTDRQVRRIREGVAVPSRALLHRMNNAENDPRLVAGIGFIDTLLHQLRFINHQLGIDLFAMAEAFFPAHAVALAESTRESGTFVQFARQGDNLLLHPGFERIWQSMPSALWRAHAYCLLFARMSDLAQAYVQFGSEDNEDDLNWFFADAETRYNDSPFGWMEALRDSNNVVPFRPPVAPP